MEPLNNICPIAQRRYEDVPIDKVKVINSRNRDQEQFDMNVESIEGVGLMKPIRVNDKFLESTGKYELICGEGRLLAHKQLGKTHVAAEVVTCTRKELLNGQSLTLNFHTEIWDPHRAANSVAVLISHQRHRLQSSCALCNLDFTALSETRMAFARSLVSKSCD